VKRSFLLILSIGAAASSGCAAVVDPSTEWSFALSRSFYEQDVSWPACRQTSDTGGMALAALFVAPLAIDLVLLPIALPRDLLVAK